MLQKTEPSPPARSKLRRFVTRTLWLLVLAAAAVGAWHWYQSLPHGSAAKATAAPARVPVDVAAAAREDFPVYLNGLGVAQAWNTVTIRTRVDGQIDKVNFNEGETVRKGELLLQIDPRPFQASLDQALAKKTLDESLLANSKRDL